MIRLCAFADEASEKFEEQILALKRNGISLIELRGLDGVNIAKISTEDAKKYSDMLKEAGIGVWSIGSPIGKVNVDCDFEEYKNSLRHVCALANIFGTKKIRVFSFFEAYGSEKKVFEYLSEMVKVAEEYGVELCHENEKQIYGDTVDRVLNIMKNVKGLKFVYDPANYLEVGEDSRRSLDKLHHLTDYFHIKDFIKNTGELVPAGYGDGMIGELVSRIADKDKVLTLEPHLAVFSGYSDIDNTEMKNKFKFANNCEAFDTAVNALKKVITDQGYVYNEEKGGYVRMEEKIVRYGIIGLGNQGSTYICNIFEKGLAKNARVTAICDINPAKIENIKKKTGRDDFACFDNYIDMLDSGLCDAVLVEVPHYSHPEMVVECLKNLHK